MDDEESHPDPCWCRWTWSLEEEEEARIEPELPLEERLRTLLCDSEGRHRTLLIKKGDHVDLQQLLFTPERDYLIKFDGQKVHKNELLNKYVLLFIFPLVHFYQTVVMARELVELRSLLWDKGSFEIVSVGLSPDTNLSMQEMYFEEYSSWMTWPFIPFDDRDARERVKSTFGFSKSFVENIRNFYITPYLGIVDPTGKLLQSWAWNMLNYYLHDAFPFTDEKIISLYEEEASTFTEGVSLKALLGTPTRDYVLSPKGEKVLIQDLEDKVVCIILDKGYTHKIEEIFEDVKSDALPDFVPVYVSRHFTRTIHPIERIDYDEDLGENVCESAGWFRIPYGDSSARKIWRVILPRTPKGSYGGICNVVGPHGSYVDFYVLDCMQEFGTEAYPFTRRRSGELVAQKLEFDFPFEDFVEPACHINLSGGFEVVLHPDCRIFCNDDEQKVGDAHVLYNKRLLILFGTRSCCELGRFLCELKSLYKQKKGTHEEFEVIYISLDCLQSDFDDSTSRMPWFALPFRIKEEEKAMIFLEYYNGRMPWCGNIPAIAAFERDGRCVGVEGDLHLKKDRSKDFPYVNSIADDYIKETESHCPKKPNKEFWRKF